MNWPDVGAFHHSGDSCTFTVWAPLAKKLSLHTSGQSHQPEKLEHGYYSITLPGIKAGTLYHYSLDDGKLLPDPASRLQPGGVHGASAVCASSFNWTDENWQGIDPGELIIYEIHTGCFSPAGDFKSVIEKLPWLHSLGVNAIELMPVGAFPGTRDWGYDVVFPFAVHTAYGGREGLKELVDAAHRSGIAVILDVVYNHLGAEGNYLVEYAPYLTDKYKTPWGPAVNFDDAYADGVRHYYWQNALMWLDEFHIDGLRLDAVHAIRDFGADHFLAVLQRKVEVLQAQTGVQKFLIAESDLNDPRIIQPVAAGGYGLAAQWNDEFHHALHALLTGERNGYYQDFGQSWHLVKSLRHSYVYTGQYSESRKRHFGVPVGNLPYNKFVVFLQNHDQVGNRAEGERIASLLSFELLKLAAAMVLLSPHIPLLFMGEEYGEKAPFNFFVDYGDPAIGEATKKGRQEEFSAFHQGDNIPDPTAEATFRKSKLSWDLNPDNAKALFSFYQYLIALRKSRPALRSAGRDQLEILPVTEQGIIAFSKHTEKEQLLLFFNLHPSGSKCSFPLSAASKKIFDSSALSWNGPGEPEVNNHTEDPCWPINPQSVVIFEKPL
jgi:maltooligosyltrehalose trehalohydrolase